MGFKDARALIIEALLDGRVDHETRAAIGEKNLLYTEEVTSEFVIRLLRRCAGWEYSTSRHHTQNVDCHIFTPSMGDERWYIKAYLQNGRAFFVSVHP